MKVRNGSKRFIKDINRTQVINEIRKNEGISRTDISKNLKLGLSTITNIIEELINEELVYEIGEDISTGGRKPVLLNFNKNYGNVIGIKIEEHKILVSLTNLKGEILFNLKANLTEKISGNILIDTIKKAVYEIIKVNNIKNKLMGIGIAVSGLVDQKEGKLIYSGLLSIENVELSKELENEFGVPVYVDNDVNVYSLAELYYGKGKNRDNFVVITYGTGIGCGIVIDRKIYYGELGGAGEFGHMVILPEGRMCECGAKGCLEAYAAENAMRQYILENISKYEGCKINYIDNLTINRIEEYASNGEKLAIDALALSARWLGYGILSLINLLNPATIILASEGMKMQKFMLPTIKEIVKNNFFRKHPKQIEIVVSEMENEAWQLGAATLAISKIFELKLYEEAKKSL
ncbi:Sugar kinase of the NBD/HSP70 family, may contain an N-terminal HTH domain [Clostridium cavendishii DSM 21758]|uniref:Sugar kinase of the NBD/HSP70 family, may contain an N-terminal HTH domain n=1 Tax=Clostridium cavendishii DSM 21758 TaxID=1121302 RepID=A0A1M6HV27_9CLOT|nr:ROK family transcriptional regulator [Clostridium cavendishii]SHJ25968.1 Sugar kinase of the NBD/HSP70 family, may contain an N-terminal HTH domain [Clostridium cavendishii DSM 21758]